jgi:hypothetical protein
LLQVVSQCEGVLSGPDGAALLQLAKLLDAHPSLHQMLLESPEVSQCDVRQCEPM